MAWVCEECGYTAAAPGDCPECGVALVEETEDMEEGEGLGDTEEADEFEED